jgi:hypothetical protein
MTSQPTRSYLIALTNPLPGKEAEFNDWYTNVHLKEVVAVDGFICGRRFKLTSAQFGGQAPQLQYMVIYEVEAGKAQAIVDNLRAAYGTFRFDPVVDLSNSPSFLVESICDTYRKADS